MGCFVVIVDMVDAPRIEPTELSITRKQTAMPSCCEDPLGASIRQSDSPKHHGGAARSAGRVMPGHDAWGIMLSPRRSRQTVWAGQENVNLCRLHRRDAEHYPPRPYP